MPNMMMIADDLQLQNAPWFLKLLLGDNFLNAAKMATNRTEIFKMETMFPF